MNAAKVICVCAVLLALTGEVAGMAPERRAALWTSLNLVLGNGPPSSKPTAGVAEPAAAAAMPTVPTRGGLDAVVIPPDRDGQFQTAVEIEGQRLPVMIDTGATYVCLTFEDADRLGIRPLPTDFKYVSNTANGPVAYARSEIAEIRLDQIAVRHVTTFVAPRGALFRTLLGMNFLSKLRGFRVEDGRLVLQL
ncbi:MAG TPA: TIGR02281 family clan AA aspartic protease [Lichenihabitans sp.]|jgi:aspartyl protease family protein|nr:TIGR02281 family clan AA aspartic protease [Lichenihabitans sp.]